MFQPRTDGGQAPSWPALGYLDLLGNNMAGPAGPDQGRGCCTARKGVLGAGGQERQGGGGRYGGTRGGRGGALLPLLLRGRAGEVPAAGQLAGRTVYIPRALRDRLDESNRGERGPHNHGGAPHPQPRRSRWRRAL